MMLRFGSDQIKPCYNSVFVTPGLHKISPASTFVAQRGYGRLCTVLHPDRMCD